jgi:hypothetical protein
MVILIQIVAGIGAILAAGAGLVFQLQSGQKRSSESQTEGRSAAAKTTIVEFDSRSRAKTAATSAVAGSREARL